MGEQWPDRCPQISRSPRQVKSRKFHRGSRDLGPRTSNPGLKQKRLVFRQFVFIPSVSGPWPVFATIIYFMFPSVTVLCCVHHFVQLCRPGLAHPHLSFPTCTFPGVPRASLGPGNPPFPSTLPPAHSQLARWPMWGVLLPDNDAYKEVRGCQRQVPCALPQSITAESPRPSFRRSCQALKHSSTPQRFQQHDRICL